MDWWGFVGLGIAGTSGLLMLACFVKDVCSCCEFNLRATTAQELDPKSCRGGLRRRKPEDDELFQEVAILETPEDLQSHVIRSKGTYVSVNSSSKDSGSEKGGVQGGGDATSVPGTNMNDLETLV